jgi:hypothetical protein
MKLSPLPSVAAWIRRQPQALLCTTTITEAEIWFGIARLPEGRRRTNLSRIAEGILALFEETRILPFDSLAARSFASIMASRQAAGRSMPFPDAQIAAIAHSRGASIATRNTADFSGCGVELISPWAAH